MRWCGPDLMASYCARAAGNGTPMYLYGGRGDAERELLAERLRERYPRQQATGAVLAVDVERWTGWAAAAAPAAD